MAKKLFITAVATLVLTSIYGAFELGRGAQSVEFAADLQEFCAATLQELPSVTPERLIMELTDEWNRSLTGEVETRVTSSLQRALSAFSFSDRVVVRYGTETTYPVLGEHTMGLVVNLDRRLELMGVGGRQCSNRVLVSYTEDSALLELRLVHELGHYFGLYHEFGTYMGHPACPATHQARFDERQTLILDRWNYPGTPYVPHWVQMELDGEQDPGIPCLSTSAVVILGGIVATVVLAVASVIPLLRNRKGRPGPGFEHDPSA